MSNEKDGYPPRTLNPNGNGFSFGNALHAANSEERDNLIFADLKRVDATAKNMEYVYIPGFLNPRGYKEIGLEVTDSFGKYMAENILLTDLEIFKMNFPRLRFSRLPGIGYFFKDYHDIARKILDKQIKVYVTKETKADLGFGGVYLDNDQFVFTPDVVNDPQKNLGTIIHETTHAVQDLKKWRESVCDREVDAHFAEAYFMVLKGQDHLIKASRKDLFITLAKFRKEDPNLFKTMYFSSKLPELRAIIEQEYKPRFIGNGNENSKEFQKKQAEIDKNFSKRQRSDGIGG